MRRPTIRWGYFAAAVLAFSVGTVAVFPPEAAQAAVPSITTMGGPVNVLPSAVRSAAGAGGGLSQADVIAVYMYKASKSPEFWALYDQAKKKALTTGGALELSSDVASEAKTIYPAAAKAAPYIKVAGHAAGSVGAVVSAYDMASSLTNAGMDLVGLDATGNVCSGTGRDLWGKVVQTAAGVSSCDEWDKTRLTFEPNKDATGQYTMKALTSPNGQFTVSGQTGYSLGSYSRYWCFSGSGMPGGNDGSGYLYLVSRMANGETATTFILPTEESGKRVCGTGYAAQIGDAYNKSAEETATIVGRSQLMCIAPAWNGGDKTPGREYSFSPDNCNRGGASVISKGVADPKRTLKCVVLGTDGKEYVKESDPFFESSGVLPDPKCQDLPEGVMADTAKIVETGGDSGDQTIWDAKVNDAVKNALASTGCGLSTGTQCPLVLYKNNQSCFAGADCTGWFSDPQRDAENSPYRCEYGGKVVDLLGECGIYENRWEPKAQQSGNVLTDPKTREPLKNPKPEFQPGSNASAGATGTPADNATDLGTNNCFKNMPISLNPVSWVVEPFKCMFIARPGYPEKMQQQAAKQWAKKAPAQLSTAMAAWEIQTPADGCRGIPIDFTVDNKALPVDYHKRVMASCPGDQLAPVAPFGRLFIGVAVTLATVYALTRYVGSIFGFEPFARTGNAE